MCNQRGFTEARHFRAARPLDDRCDRFEGSSGELAKLGEPFRRRGERHERRLRVHHRDAELLGDFVAERRRAGFWNRKASGCDHDRARARRALRGRELEAHCILTCIETGNPLHDRRPRPLHAARTAFAHQHVDDLRGAAVAEKLPQRFLVIPDAIPLHEVDEVARCVACERGTAEIGIAGNERCGPRVDVGEVAAAPAGDADLLAELRRMVDEQHAPAARACDGRAHHAGRACANDYDVEVHWCHDCMGRA
jgi:hypothetical protein